MKSKKDFNEKGAKNADLKKAYQKGAVVCLKNIKYEGKSFDIYVQNIKGRPVMFTGGKGGTLEHIESAHIKGTEAGSKFAPEMVEEAGGTQKLLSGILKDTIPEDERGIYLLEKEYSKPIGGDSLFRISMLEEKLGKTKEELIKDGVINKIETEGDRRSGCYIVNDEVSNELGLEVTNKVQVVAFPSVKDFDKAPEFLKESAYSWKTISEKLDIDISKGVGVVTSMPGKYAEKVPGDASLLPKEGETPEQKKNREAGLAKSKAYWEDVAFSTASKLPKGFKYEGQGNDDGGAPKLGKGKTLSV